MAPEATLAAYTLAGEQGMWGLKIDICETADGELVCSHDLQVDRLFDGTGAIPDKTLQELKMLTVVRGTHVERYPDQKIVLFQEALEICRKYCMHPYINFKYLLDRGTVFRVVSLIRQAGMIQDTVCQCSQDIVEYLYALREVSDEIPIVFWLWEMNLIYAMPVIRTLGNACIGLNAYPNMEKRQFETNADMIHSLGMPVCASLLSRKQLPFVRSWIEKYPLDLIVTSGITYSDLPEDVTITG